MIRIEPHQTLVAHKPTVYAQISIDKKDSPPIHFRVSTYNKLKSTDSTELDADNTPDSSSWSSIFNFANSFLASLNDTQAEALYEFYKSCHRVINTNMDNLESPRDIINEIIMEVNKLLSSTNIDALAFNYVQTDKKIIYPDLSAIGTRAQDLPEFTFKKMEYSYLIAMCLICKIMCPVWGEYVHIFAKEHKVIENLGKEIHCLFMINPIIENDVFANVSDKLTDYSNRLINNFKAKSTSKTSITTTDISFLLVNHGFSVDRLNDQVFSTLFCKKFVFFNPWAADRDIMKYVSSCINDTVQSVVALIKQQPGMLVRTPPSETNDDGDGNVSFLEHKSISPHHDLSVPSIARFAAKNAIMLLINDHEIPKHDVALINEAIGDYYKDYPTITVFQKLVVGMMVGRYIGGSGPMGYMTINEWIPLIVYCQYILIKKNYSATIVSLLASITSLNDKQYLETSHIDERIRHGWDKSAAYNKLTETYNFTIAGKKMITDQVAHIRDFVVNRYHQVNNTKYINDLLNNPQPNGEFVNYDQSIVSQMCEFILNFQQSA